MIVNYNRNYFVFEKRKTIFEHNNQKKWAVKNLRYTPASNRKFKLKLTLCFYFISFVIFSIKQAIV